MMLTSTSLLLVLASLLSPALGAPPPKCKRQNVLSKDYLNPKFQQTRKTINGYSRRSLELLPEKYGSGEHGALGGGWVAQNGFAAMAAFDHLNKEDQFKGFISESQADWCAQAKGQTPFRQDCINDYNDDIAWAALGNIQAYETYGDQIYLDRGKSIFEFMTDHGFIKQSDLDAGFLENTKAKSNKLNKECDGKSMLGGVYWRSGAPNGETTDASTNEAIAAVSTGAYAWIGSRLCHHAKETKYCNSAYSALQWLDRHLVQESGLVWDNVIGSSCKKNDMTFTYNAGLYIAAYADLHRIQKNDTALALAQKTALASMSPSAPWNAKNGIINEREGDPTKGDDAVSFKAILIRALRSSIDVFPPNVQAAIRQYINIQYYGMTNLASNNPNEPVEYARNWTGPADFVTSSSQTMIAAIDVLNGIFVNPDEAFPATDSKDKPVISVA